MAGFKAGAPYGRGKKAPPVASMPETKAAPKPAAKLTPKPVSEPRSFPGRSGPTQMPKPTRGNASGMPGGIGMPKARPSGTPALPSRVTNVPKPSPMGTEKVMPHPMPASKLTANIQPSGLPVIAGTARVQGRSTAPVRVASKGKSPAKRRG